MSLKNLFRSKAPAPTPIQQHVTFAKFDDVMREPTAEKAIRRQGRVPAHHKKSADEGANAGVPRSLQRPPRGRHAASRGLGTEYSAAPVSAHRYDQLVHAATFEEIAQILGNDLPAEAQPAHNTAAARLDQIANAASFDDIAKILGN